MGARKRNTADAKKEAAKSRYQAVLKNCPTSPRKMRLVTDLISGMEVNKALDVLKFSPQEASRRVGETYFFQQLLTGRRRMKGQEWKKAIFIVKEIHVDGGRALKRLQTAPQGRAHRIRKDQIMLPLCLTV